LALEYEILGAKQFFQAGYLIGDLGDVRLGKALRLSAKWDIELTLAIEADHSVEPGPIQKEKVQRIVALIESVPHLIVVVFALL
jgi:hypothetical protein